MRYIFLPLAKAPGLPACLSLSRFVCPLSLRLHTPVNVLFTCCSRAHFGIPAQTNPPTQPTHPTPPHPPIPAQPSPVHPPQPFPSHPKRKKEKEEKEEKREKEKGKKKKGRRKKFLRRGFLFRSPFIKAREPLKAFEPSFPCLPVLLS